MKKVFQFSFANILESLAAARDSIKAIGVKIIQGIHIPKKGLMTCESARFSPVVIIEKYKMKITAAMTTGAPNPPFLIMEPSDAPIKNRITSVTERANFL